MVSNLKDKNISNLLGVMVVGKADVYTIKDWLHRHVRIFDKLAIIDGSYNEWARQEMLKHDNVFVIGEESLNLTKITDQTLRKPAMQVLGNPVGSWILVCHADEFWTIDPRRLVFENVRQDPDVSLLRLTVLTASPLESEYKKAVHRLDTEKTWLQDNGFHIMSVSNLVHSTNGTDALAKLDYFENRLFLWEEGMEWGTNHSLVIPEHNPKGYRKKQFRKAFLVHFKLHDFSTNALRRNGLAFHNSKLKTSLRNNSAEGWMGTFLDQSFPENLKRFPPRPIEKGLQDLCKKVDRRWPCELPWTLNATFR